ncbi:MAG: hypothetical protein PHE70_07605 [Tepidanaerobacteraceae bacterium]|nr:hypothetical protein [Tepidanaerobacteraceae bacterium]
MIDNMAFNNKGYSLVIVIFVSTIILLIGMAVLNMSTNEFLIGCYTRDHTLAYYLAEGGLQKALSILKQNPYYEGDTVWRDLGEGQYQVKIEEKVSDIDVVIITSKGKVNKSEVSIEATVNVQIEIDEEIYPDPPHRNVEIQVLSWKYKGPI